MAFHNETLPDAFQYGSTAGAGFATIIQQTASGHEYRVSRQAQAVHRLSLRSELRNASEAKALKAFALGRRGALHSFRIKTGRTTRPTPTARPRRPCSTS